tara:strand:- start:601 stop:813 length:213 start_codon:yes stop_codon:yes gene_type:complete
MADTPKTITDELADTKEEVTARDETIEQLRSRTDELVEKINDQKDEIESLRTAFKGLAKPLIKIWVDMDS